MKASEKLKFTFYTLLFVAILMTAFTVGFNVYFKVGVIYG